LAIQVALILLFAALTALGALIKVDLGYGIVPFTMQVFVVMLAGLTLGAKDGALSQIVYLAAATMGAPITAGGIGGPAIWFKPTAGYLIGFVLGAFLTGLLTDWGARRSSFWRWVASAVALLPIYALGCAWLTLTSSKIAGNWALGWQGGVVPFIVIDLAKAAVAALIATGENWFYQIRK
jgi:biotin transport system substrate-specific component